MRWIPADSARKEPAGQFCRSSRELSDCRADGQGYELFCNRPHKRQDAAQPDKSGKLHFRNCRTPYVKRHHAGTRQARA